ncbi:MAG TPA: serine/threonine-protein kinase [Polyangiaceae bacterium]
MEPEQRIGEVIGSRYRLDELLSRGGQGWVFAGTDLRHGDAVALKVLRGEFANDPEWRERMFREAQALVRLSRAAVVRILDQVYSNAGELCLVMERLRGVDFEQFLGAREDRGERSNMAELVALLAPIAEALDLAHDFHILHRDVKPSNIFVLEGGGVRLLDFGFVRFMGRSGLTQLGFVAGSPSYLAPEAWRGEHARLDRRVDVYAFGAVLYRALAGEPPFANASIVQLLELVTTGRRPSLHARRPDLPSSIDDWVEQALAIDPEHRFQRVGALWAAFATLAQKSSSP